MQPWVNFLTSNSLFSKMEARIGPTCTISPTGRWGSSSEKEPGNWIQEWSTHSLLAREATDRHLMRCLSRSEWAMISTLAILESIMRLWDWQGGVPPGKATYSKGGAWGEPSLSSTSVCRLLARLPGAKKPAPPLKYVTEPPKYVLTALTSFCKF